MLGFRPKRTNLHEKYDYPSKPGAGTTFSVFLPLLH
jgi:hypothetical protein